MARCSPQFQPTADPHGSRSLRVPPWLVPVRRRARALRPVRATKPARPPPPAPPASEPQACRAGESGAALPAAPREPARHRWLTHWPAPSGRVLIRRAQAVPMSRQPRSTVAQRLSGPPECRLQETRRSSAALPPQGPQDLPLRPATRARRRAVTLSPARLKLLGCSLAGLHLLLQQAPRLRPAQRKRTLHPLARCPPRRDRGGHRGDGGHGDATHHRPDRPPPVAWRRGRLPGRVVVR
jgi:hypothetical protein